MSVFGLNETEIKNGYESAAQNPNNVSLDSLDDNALDSDKPETPNFFTGSLEAAGRGVQSASVDLMALTNKATGFDFGLKMQPEEFQRASVEINKSLEPTPEITGWLGSHVIYPLTRVAAQAVPATVLAGPVGGAAAIGTSQGNIEYERLKSEGVDNDTALKAAIVAGGTQAAGFGLPAAVGGRLLMKAVSGAAINAIVGGTQRGVTGKILDDAGYSEMADQYKVLDSSAVLTDVILGAAFGSLHGLGKKRGEDSPLPSEVDTALVANNLNQLEIDAAPGIPSNIKTRNSHVAAMKTATDQLIKNEPVNIEKHFDNPEFIQKPETESAHEDFQKAAEEHGIERKDIWQTAQSAPLKRETEYGEVEFPDDRHALLYDYAVNHLDKSTSEANLAAEKLLQEWKDVPIIGDEPFIKTKEDLDSLAADYIGKGSDTSNLEAYASSKNPQDLLVIDEEERPAYLLNLVEKLKQDAAVRDSSPLEMHEIDSQHITPEDAQRINKSVQQEELPLAKEGKAAESEKPEPENNIVQNILTDKPDLIVMDEEGNPISALEAFNKAQEDLVEAQHTADLFDVAINCFIRNGDEG